MKKQIIVRALPQFLLCCMRFFVFFMQILLDSCFRQKQKNVYLVTVFLQIL